MTSLEHWSARRVASFLSRGAALLLVLVLFSILGYHLTQGSPGARLSRAVNAHRSPAAPDVKLSVIWARAGTWPARLRTAVDHGTFRLADLHGYPVVLNFWASWCGPCRREAAVLASAAEARKGRVVFVGVDVNDLTGDARRFLRGHGVPYVAVHSGNSTVEQFGLIGLPETFYLDRRGRIDSVTRGQVSAPALDRGLALVAG
jgi:cytochrome c biogenesis protein CcmG/thiol:disulfide interchange protein DsbE